jgi:hypothetical protein
VTTKTQIFRTQIDILWGPQLSINAFLVLQISDDCCSRRLLFNQESETEAEVDRQAVVRQPDQSPRVAPERENDVDFLGGRFADVAPADEGQGQAEGGGPAQEVGGRRRGQAPGVDSKKPGTDVMIFKIFSSKKIAKNWRF